MGEQRLKEPTHAGAFHKCAAAAVLDGIFQELLFGNPLRRPKRSNFPHPARVVRPAPEKVPIPAFVGFCSQDGADLDSLSCGPNQAEAVQPTQDQGPRPREEEISKSRAAGLDKSTVRLGKPGIHVGCGTARGF
jgi:hypothetical protein